jgi:3-oxoacyl-[acyl-carrier-protein] synthase II
MKRVVVTGIGAVTPLGNSAPEMWKNALEGKSGIGAITRFDASACAAQIAGEVKNFVVPAILSPKDAKKIGRFAQLSVGASYEAYQDSGLETFRTQIAPERMGVNVGIGMGGLPEIEDTYDDFKAKGFRRISPFFILQSIPNLASGQVSVLFNLKGPNHCNVSACATSAHSIGESVRTIQRGEADVMLAGGGEAVVCALGVGGFAAMRALSTRNDAPQKASRPFDKDRDGFVLSEGAAVLVLEEFELAKKRGAKIYGEIIGYGATGDAYHLSSPAPEAEGAQRAMTLALAEARLTPQDIGYVNAHSTSTPLGDIEEAQAIARVFHAAKAMLHVSSTKSMTGHLLGAAGATEAIFSLLALREGRIPPTINLDDVDPACAALGLNFTPHDAAEKPLKHVMSNSFGFGGTNGTLVFGKV